MGGDRGFWGGLQGVRRPGSWGVHGAGAQEIGGGDPGAQRGVWGWGGHGDFEGGAQGFGEGLSAQFFSWNINQCRYNSASSTTGGGGLINLGAVSANLGMGGGRLH